MKKLVSVLIVGFIAVISVSSCGNNEQAKKQADTPAVAKPSAAAQAPVAAIDTGHLVGAWHDEAIKTDDGKDIAYEVVSKGHKVYIQAITFTGKELTLNDAPPITASASEIVKHGDKYVGVHSPSEIYKIDEHGNLLIYDGETLVAVCKKIL
ncbi:hypothetical protein ACFQZX_14900 [Mucilaginibacter litoreus]|uniref:Lipoprotein n=1 Tax=Mucilaginibacter litoreus TaxID=1048221 RepID=A0ABW3AV20_9SPHI